MCHSDICLDYWYGKRPISILEKWIQATMEDAATGEGKVQMAETEAVSEPLD